jgi:hypothetical protein
MSQDDLSRLENALRGLAPVPVQLDRDRLMFDAGRAIHPTGWKWPLATGALSVVAVVLGVCLFMRPEPRVVERIVRVYVPAQPLPAPAPPTPGPDSTPGEFTSPGPTLPGTSGYLQLQEQVLRWGLDGVPAARPTPPPPQTPDTVEKLLKSF